MKTTMKKVLSMALALVLLLGCLPFQAFAADVCQHESIDGLFHDAGNGEHYQLCKNCKANGTDPTWFGYEAHSGGTATCIAKAKCSKCGVEYGAVNASNHVRTELKNVVTATCGNPGYTGDTYCLDCGTIIATGTATDATTNHTAVDSTYGKDATQHWQVCANGGHYFGYAPHSWTAASCTAAKTCSVCGYVDGTPSDHVWIAATCSAAKKCSVCGHTEGNPNGHTWVDATCTNAKFCSVCGVKEGAALGHSWSNNSCTRCGVAYSAIDKFTVTFDPNYNTAPATVISNVASGTKISGMYTPVRDGYIFEGWYYDANMTSIVPAGATVTSSVTVYAKWKQIAPYNVSVVVYTNGNKNTPTVTLDLYSWAQDGVITLTDLKRAIEINGIKANNNAGLSVYGPFTPNQWTSYIAHDYYRNSTEKVTINNGEVTVLYAMVHNVKITKGTVDPYGAIADKTNPKTGDMIFAPVAVMGLSVSALAVLLYLNKKRAF